MTLYRLYRIEPPADDVGDDPEVGWGEYEVRTEVLVEKLPHWQTWYAEVPDAE